jgi:hypothetical protein
MGDPLARRAVRIRGMTGAWPVMPLTEIFMKRTLLAIALVAIALAGCVVVPARPVVVRAPVVVY